MIVVHGVDRDCVTCAPLLTTNLFSAHRWHSVLATLVLWMGCIVSAPLGGAHRICGSSKSDLARATVKRLAHEAYPHWVARRPNGACPTVEQLAEYAGSARDPWGEPYRVRCDSLPDAAGGIAVWSEGENRRDEGGAGDDLASWMR